MHHPRVVLIFVLFIFLLATLPIFVFLSVRSSETAHDAPSARIVNTVGVILTGPADSYGWGTVGGDYTPTIIDDVQVIVFDRLNDTDRPGVTLSSVEAAMRSRGARYVWVALTRQEIDPLLAVLPPAGANVAVAPVDPPKTSSNSAKKSGLSSATIVILGGFLTIGLTFAAWWKSDLRQMKSKSSKGKKRQMGTGAHAKALAIERAVQGRATNFAPLGVPLPLVHKLSTYVFGDYHFDESFSIELPNGEFLGECGLGITAPISRVDATRITALEVWIFDKNDPRTCTHVIASQHAFNDPAMRGKLEPKGEVIQADVDAVTVLETRALRLQARVLDVQYGFTDTLPAGSFFDHLVLEIAVWQKK
jgi:hypothetical protein